MSVHDEWAQIPIERIQHLDAISLRSRVFAKSDGKCHYCGITLVRGRNARRQRDFMTIDHMIPKSKGGSTGISNLVAACRRCNSLKGDRMPNEPD